MVNIFNNRYKGLFLLLFFFSVENVGAQDIHLSQYFTSNATLNPGMIGYFNGNYKATLNHRNQWRQINDPLITNVISLEKNFENYGNDFFGALVIANDQLSTYGQSNTRILLGGGYQHYYNHHEFRAGAQVGYVFGGSDLGQQSFPGQWNYGIGEFDQSIDNGEDGLGNRVSYLDVNLGVVWSHVFGKIRPTVGYGVFHVNRPQKGMLNNGESIAMRHVLHGDLDVVLSKKLHLVPGFLWMQMRNASDLVISGRAKYGITDDVDVILGGAFRTTIDNGDSPIIIAGIGYKGFQFTFSRDFTISDLNTVGTTKSAYEIGLSFTSPKNTPSKVTIPCDRF